MTPRQKAALTRRAERLAIIVCERMANGELKLVHCPGCTVTPAIDRRDYAMMRKFVDKWSSK